jgi:hypothetical protein
VRYPATVVDRVRDLAQRSSDGEIAESLNREGQVSAHGKPFSVSMIEWIRYCNASRSFCPMLSV